MTTIKFETKNNGKVKI